MLAWVTVANNLYPDMQGSVFLLLLRLPALVWRAGPCYKAALNDLVTKSFYREGFIYGPHNRMTFAACSSPTSTGMSQE